MLKKEEEAKEENMDVVMARKKRPTLLQMKLEVSSFKFWRHVALINTPFHVAFSLASQAT